LKADWLIGEDCLLPDVKGVALRSLKAPGEAFNTSHFGKNDPQPRTMDDYIETKEDHGGVHTNSGIPNHAFYLVAKGMAEAGFSEYAWEEAGQIWFKSLTHGDMEPRCSFEQFAKITYNVANDEYGSKVANVVRDAWETVKVLVPVSGLQTLRDPAETSAGTSIESA
jgi:Zn-dependent metalloprotease